VRQPRRMRVRSRPVVGVGISGVTNDPQLVLRLDDDG